jgi:hypothetical protein
MTIARQQLARHVPECYAVNVRCWVTSLKTNAIIPICFNGDLITELLLSSGCFLAAIDD